MAEGKGPAAEPADRVLVITRLIDAPRSLLFKAWTQPEHLVRWWGPRGFTTPFCQVDVRPGGAWRMGMRSAEGKEYWHQGVYREVVEPERLVFTYAWEDPTGKPGHETLVTVAFAEQDGKTKLTFRQGVFETAADRDGHEEGWSSCFDVLEEHLAAA